MSTLRTDNKIIYIHIPKTAGTAISAIPFIGNFGYQTSILYFKDLLDHGFFQGYSFNDFWKFGFVRNPWDRLVSGYFHLNPKGTAQSFQNFIKNDFSENFRDESLFFLKPQYKYLCDDQDNIMVDFLGRFENLNEDWKVVCNHVGEYKELGNERKQYLKPYKEYYDEQSKLIVEQIYKKDIEIFNYEY